LLISLCCVVRSNRKHRFDTILHKRIEQLIQIQNIVFIIICSVVLCGTAAPILFQWLFNRDISTGTSFFHVTTIPLFTCILFIMAYVHYMGLFSQSKPNSASDLYSHTIRHAQQLQFTKSVALARLWNHVVLCCIGVRWYKDMQSTLLCTAFLALCQLSIAYSITDLCILELVYVTVCFIICCYIVMSLTSKGNIVPQGCYLLFKPYPSRLARLTNRFVNTAISMRVSHAGTLLFILGAVLSSRNKTQLTQIMHFGEQVQLGHNMVSFRSVDLNYGPTYHSICGSITIYKPDAWLINRCDFKDDCFVRAKAQPFGAMSLKEYNDTVPVLSHYMQHKQHNNPALLCMFPEKRFFISNPTLNTTKVAIHTNLCTDYYALIGAGSTETGWYTTIMQLPFMCCIWIGFILGAFGGLASLHTLMKMSRLHWN
jgi:cytochrome c biogenesis factor